MIENENIQSEPEIEYVAPKRGRGRPPGSSNRPKDSSRERVRKHRQNKQDLVEETAFRESRNLVFFGEESYDMSASSYDAELKIHREFLRALNQPDVQPGESLRMLAKRCWEFYQKAPTALRDKDDPTEMYVPSFIRPRQAFSHDYGHVIDPTKFDWTPPGKATEQQCDEPINIEQLPPLIYRQEPEENE